MATAFMLFFIKSARLLRLKIKRVGKSEAYVGYNYSKMTNKHI